MKTYIAPMIAVILLSTPVFGQTEAELAKRLSNPVAALISVPIQANYDSKIGMTEDGSVWRINIQPVVPFSLTDNWNLISRTILPVVSQQDIPMDGAGESGIGDIVQSLFFSPKAPTSGGLIWGVGPVFLLPTATDAALGTEKWGFGPTAVALKQAGPWTFGGLVNHIQSFAGEDARQDVSATFVQPFVSYITKTRTTIGLNAETTYDWENEQWSVPVNLTVNQLLKVGSRIIQLGVGARYWADSPNGGPQDLAGRVQLTFLFPR
jgi:hypothetical protein